MQFVVKVVVLGLVLVSSVAAQAKNPNVLLICVDDLRPELNCYGAEHIHSPNIDQLAAEGLRFDRAYCQIAVCGASRASLLSGTRPETTSIWDYKTPMRSTLPDVRSLPQQRRRSYSPRRTPDPKRSSVAPLHARSSTVPPSMPTATCGRAS